jgi:hypothetical protein
MEYSRPELTLLGDAARMIQGSKSTPGDGNGDQLPLLDCELDD